MELLELIDTDKMYEDIKENPSAAEKYERVHTDEEADDVLARVIWAQKKICENDELVKKKKEQLQKLLKDYEARLNGGLKTYLENQQVTLRNYLDEKLNGKKGTVKLLHGNIRLKEDNGKTMFDDENLVIQYLQNRNMEDACVSIKKTIRKTDFKKLFKKDPSGHYFVDEDGQVIHGVHIEKEDGLQLGITPAKEG